MQSLCALGHYDFNAAGEHGYEQAFSVIQRLNLGHATMREMYRRMVFNVVARNQDDHTPQQRPELPQRGARMHKEKLPEPVLRASSCLFVAMLSSHVTGL